MLLEGRCERACCILRRGGPTSLATTKTIPDTTAITTPTTFPCESKSDLPSTSECEEIATAGLCSILPEGTCDRTCCVQRSGGSAILATTISDTTTTGTVTTFPCETKTDLPSAAECQQLAATGLCSILSEGTCDRACCVQRRGGSAILATTIPGTTTFPCETKTDSPSAAECQQLAATGLCSILPEGTCDRTCCVQRRGGAADPDSLMTTTVTAINDWVDVMFVSNTTTADECAQLSAEIRTKILRNLETQIKSRLELQDNIPGYANANLYCGSVIIASVFRFKIFNLLVQSLDGGHISVKVDEIGYLHFKPKLGTYKPPILLTQGVPTVAVPTADPADKLIGSASIDQQLSSVTGWFIAIAIIVPLLVIILVIVICCLYLRARRRDDDKHTEVVKPITDEMKLFDDSEARSQQEDWNKMANEANWNKMANEANWSEMAKEANGGVKQTSISIDNEAGRGDSKSSVSGPPSAIHTDPTGNRSRSKRFRQKPSRERDASSIDGAKNWSGMAKEANGNIAQRQISLPDDDSVAGVTPAVRSAPPHNRSRRRRDRDRARSRRRRSSSISSMDSMKSLERRSTGRRRGGAAGRGADIDDAQSQDQEQVLQRRTSERRRGGAAGRGADIDDAQSQDQEQVLQRRTSERRRGGARDRGEVQVLFERTPERRRRGARGRGADIDDVQSQDQRQILQRSTLELRREGETGQTLGKDGMQSVDQQQLLEASTSGRRRGRVAGRGASVDVAQPVTQQQILQSRTAGRGARGRGTNVINTQIYRPIAPVMNQQQFSAAPVTDLSVRREGVRSRTQNVHSREQSRQYEDSTRMSERTSGRVDRAVEISTITDTDKFRHALSQRLQLRTGHKRSVSKLDSSERFGQTASQQRLSMGQSRGRLHRSNDLLSNDPYASPVVGTISVGPRSGKSSYGKSRSRLEVLPSDARLVRRVDTVTRGAKTRSDRQADQNVNRVVDTITLGPKRSMRRLVGSHHRRRREDEILQDSGSTVVSSGTGSLAQIAESSSDIAADSSVVKSLRFGPAKTPNRTRHRAKSGDGGIITPVGVGPVKSSDDSLVATANLSPRNTAEGGAIKPFIVGPVNTPSGTRQPGNSGEGGIITPVGVGPATANGRSVKTVLNLRRGNSRRTSMRQDDGIVQSVTLGPSGSRNDDSRPATVPSDSRQAIKPILMMKM